MVELLHAARRMARPHRLPPNRFGAIWCNARKDSARGYGFARVAVQQIVFDRAFTNRLEQSVRVGAHRRFVDQRCRVPAANGCRRQGGDGGFAELRFDVVLKSAV
jgi:hypothetical protein